MTASVTKSFNDTLYAQIPRVISQSVDKGVKDSLARYFGQERIAEAVTKSLLASLQPLVVESFRGVFANMVVPGFERASQNLFVQLHQTFQQGINQGSLLLSSFFFLSMII